VPLTGSLKLAGGSGAPGSRHRRSPSSCGSDAGNQEWPEVSTCTASWGIGTRQGRSKEQLCRRQNGVRKVLHQESGYCLPRTAQEKLLGRSRKEQLRQQHFSAGKMQGATLPATERDAQCTLSGIRVPSATQGTRGVAGGEVARSNSTGNLPPRPGRDDARSNSAIHETVHEGPRSQRDVLRRQNIVEIRDARAP